MNQIQHYVTGDGDDSLAALADAYGTTANAISNATFGGTGASLIYPWLRDHGGKRQGANSAVPTGYNWCFAPGMVVNVPTSELCQSPVFSYADIPAIPGGPLVTIIYTDTAEIGDTGAPSSGRENWNNSGTTVAEATPIATPGKGGILKAAMGGGIWTWLGIAAGMYFMFPEWFGGGKKVKTKRRKTSRKRKTTRRRRRR